jgi:hypothetical protein
VTNQLQYGAQQELLECKKKFLGCIYSSIREIESQITVVDRLLADDHEAREPSRPPSKTEELLHVYKRDLKRNLQAVQDESVDAARDFDDNGLKIREENKRVAEAREQKDRRRGWSALVGGWKPGQASSSNVFPQRLGPFSQQAVPAADLPSFSFVDGTKKQKVQLIVEYGEKERPVGWRRDWGKCECYGSSIDDIVLSNEVRRGLGIHENAKSFAWVYPAEALMTVDDQSKIAFAQVGPQSSLLAFGGFIYFDQDTATMVQQGIECTTGKFANTMKPSASSVGDDVQIAKCKLLSANALATAANAPSKRKLQFRAPTEIPKHKMREAATAHEFRRETIRSKQAHATSFTWIGPGQRFGDLTTEYGALVYYCVKGDGLWFDILPESQPQQRRDSSSSSSPSSSRQSLPSPSSFSATFRQQSSPPSSSSASLGSSLPSPSLAPSHSKSQVLLSSVPQMESLLMNNEDLCARGLKKPTDVDWHSWSAKVRYMSERVKKEQEKNVHLQEDEMQAEVRFGQAIQLRHVKSGRFLEVKTRDGSAELADVEKDNQCYKVELTPHEGSEGSWFHFRAFRWNQTAGGAMHSEANASPVIINTCMLLQSNTLNNFQLHTTRALPLNRRHHLAFDPHRTEVNLSNFSTHFASAAAAAADARPRSSSGAETPTQDVKGEGGEEDVDAEGKGGEETAANALETNGAGGYVWKLHRYSCRPTPENKAFIQFGQALRLYHPSAEAFICASADKGAKGASKAHACYLQSLGINGGSFNPDDNSNQSAKQIFVLESGDDNIGFQQHGGTATWQCTCRFRHIASGKYLKAEQLAAILPSPRSGGQRSQTSTATSPLMEHRHVSSPRSAPHPGSHCDVASGSDGCYVPVLVHLCQKPVAERDVAAWEQTKFRLIKSQIPLSKGGGIQYLKDICIKVAESEHDENSTEIGFWLATGFLRKERFVSGVSSFGHASDRDPKRSRPKLKRASSVCQNHSSFDQEKTKGLSMYFAIDELDHNACDVQASFVDEDCLRRVEGTLAQRAVLRAIYTPGKWGSTLRQPAETTILQKDPRKADERLKTMLQTMISELLDQR